MRKYKSIFLVFFLAFLLSACAGQSPGSAPAPVSSSVGFPAESGAVSVPSSSRDISSGEASSAGDGSSSAAESSSVPSEPASSSKQGLVSKVLNPSSETVVMSSSLPPKAAPAPSAKPMPAVTAKMPQAPGTEVFSKSGASVDYSNAGQGYVMVRYSGSSVIKVLVYFNGGSSYYQYNLAGNGAYAALPLQSGSGTYKVRFMENVSGNSYAELCSTELSASVSGWGYTLYPNQYVSYGASSAAVAKAKSLCASATNNAQKVSAIYQFITSAIKYDYQKARSVKAGYLPNVDSTLSAGTGICFDYAALMAAMCRAQGIPTRLIIGNTSVGYHAWNEIYLDGWKRYDSTFAAAGQSAGTYTAEKYY
ncbi:transglutaminase-like domain-containing protein [Caproiciproducens sp. CPB-2]|uniref:transglutaminase-like domain-containing protein n=1 Tax=Caproiciproducens sp. CPB-2 TaxID=3030017 RepID=UPI0023DC6AD6|nr:transglutaminase-like domain-containing protein [Caproiciproducens sp. CPB-2]MDF1494709.1 transglutaminase-like domain-containing protein [Caproiciproducens sp. CPB-2]